MQPRPRSPQQEVTFLPSLESVPESYGPLAGSPHPVTHAWTKPSVSGARPPETSSLWQTLFPKPRPRKIAA